jgi:hypothetical protein
MVLIVTVFKKNWYFFIFFWGGGSAANYFRKLQNDHTADKKTDSRPVVPYFFSQHTNVKTSNPQIFDMSVLTHQ